MVFNKIVVPDYFLRISDFSIILQTENHLEYRIVTLLNKENATNVNVEPKEEEEDE